MDEFEKLFVDSMIANWIIDFCRETNCRICTETMTDDIAVLMYPDGTYEIIQTFSVISIQKMYENWKKRTLTNFVKGT